tara:strand:- start:750 stop:914 length:165 start_codon:yes stop_codon:yes gene_type:complete
MREVDTIDQIIILGIGDCFEPYLDFFDNKEVLYIHSAPEDCKACEIYWSTIETY